MFKILVENGELPSDGVQFYYFTAAWCGPCKAFGPILEKVADEIQHDIIKIDADVHPTILERFKIRGVPTLVAIKDGVSIKQNVGLLNEARLKEFISSVS